MNGQAKKLEAQAKSADWGVAEAAIKQLPGPLAADRALAILLPLAQGASNAGIGIAGWSRRHEQLTLTMEASTGRHIRSAIAALGRIPALQATRGLLEILDEMEGYAPQALDALGSPNHAACAEELEAKANDWTSNGQRLAANALWKMETEAAFEGFLRLDRSAGGGVRAFSDEVSRNAWTTAVAERRRERSAPAPEAPRRSFGGWLALGAVALICAAGVVVFSRFGGWGLAAAISGSAVLLIATLWILDARDAARSKARMTAYILAERERNRRT